MAEGNKKAKRRKKVKKLFLIGIADEIVDRFVNVNPVNFA
jgi:hypothetical protein